MCIHILYELQGKKKITNERAFANNYLPSNKKDRKHVPWPVTVDALRLYRHTQGLNTGH